MTKEEIKNILHSSNENLNKIIRDQNFIEYTNLHIPVVGQQTFQDIEGMFNFLLKEQYINETYDYNAPNSELLLSYFNITKDEFTAFKLNVARVLDSYTDSSLDMAQKRTYLKKQLVEFVGQFPTEDEEDIYGVINMYNRLYTDNQSSQTRYLNSVLSALKNAHVNQIADGKYLAIEQLSKEYIETIEVKDEFLKTKRDYLKKLKKEKEKEKFFSRIHTDIVEIYEESNHLENVSLFVFYVLYGKSKVHIYLIHSLLGVETKQIRDLYLKLFLKDKKTGSDKEFLLHTKYNPTGMTFVINDYDLVKKNKLHKRFNYESLETECQEVLDDLLYIEAIATLEEILINKIPFEKIVNFSEYEDIYKKI